MRLDDGQLTWGDLHAFIWSAQPGTAIFSSAEMGWSTTDHLIAGAVDLLAVLAWQNTQDAHEKFPLNRPKPIPRPTRETEESTEARMMPGIGGMTASVMPVEEFQRRLEERRVARGN